MSELSPNEQQKRLIESIDGVYLVDAGAGTGKTFATTRRYAQILSETEGAPDDILLLTFTRAAAGEMRDRIVERTAYEVTQLQHAPIGTFHAHCLQLLHRYGHDVPRLLGIDDQIPSSVDIVEDSVRERRLFREFLSQFADAHSEYAPYLSLSYERNTLSSLVAELAAKGVVPSEEGWYRDTGELLGGNRDEFFELFERANTPVKGANGLNNSDARGSVSDWDLEGYTPDAPSKDELHEDPRVDQTWVERAYDEDRSELLDFVHDLYFEYLEFLLERNVLTQGFVLVLAFVLLSEDDTVRRAAGHQYVMIDEFQDTNEIQFKIALLLARTNNICVVGDWKQSIYGFQYTSVENIRNFDERIQRFKRELNTDETRIDYDVDEIERIPLRKNYRSTESILSHAEATLSIPASSSETITEPDIDSLEATNFVDNSRVEAYTADDEHELILDRIQHVVGNDQYAVETSDEPRPGPDASHEERVAAEWARLEPPSLNDIAVLTRNRDFARELLRRAEEYDVPIAYQGGIELFDTPETKLVLAWLRICESSDPRGWAVALERAGYSLGEAKRIIAEDEYPDAMVEFRRLLSTTNGIGGFAQTVLQRYGRDTAIGDALVDHLAGMYEGSLAPRGEVIEDILAKMKSDATVEIDTNPGTEAVTLQTIHSVKGLEYPIVFLSNLNYRAFPHYGRGPSSRIVYDETYGLRQHKRYSEIQGRPHVYDHWQYSLLSSVLPNTYDEERRLFYVATTRAERHLVLTAGERPSRFFEGFPADSVSLDPEPSVGDFDEESSDQFSVTVSPQSRTLRTGVHDIMDDSVYSDVTDGRGAEFGQGVHDFAEAYAEGEPVSPDGPDQSNAAGFIDDLAGELRAEETVLYPVDTDPRVTLTGIVDLLHVAPNEVDIVDWKTDLSRRVHREYRLQLSVYYHVLTSVYPDREIRPTVFYTADDEPVVVDPVSTEEIEKRVREMLSL